MADNFDWDNIEEIPLEQTGMNWNNVEEIPLKSLSLKEILNAPNPIGEENTGDYADGVLAAFYSQKYGIQVDPSVVEGYYKDDFPDAVSASDAVLRFRKFYDKDLSEEPVYAATGDQDRFSWVADKRGVLSRFMSRAAAEIREWVDKRDAGQTAHAEWTRETLRETNALAEEAVTVGFDFEESVDSGGTPNFYQYGAWNTKQDLGYGLPTASKEELKALQATDAKYEQFAPESAEGFIGKSAQGMAGSLPAMLQSMALSPTGFGPSLFWQQQGAGSFMRAYLKGKDIDLIPDEDIQRAKAISQVAGAAYAAAELAVKSIPGMKGFGSNIDQQIASAVFRKMTPGVLKKFSQGGLAFGVRWMIETMEEGVQGGIGETADQIMNREGINLSEIASTSWDQTVGAAGSVFLMTAAGGGAAGIAKRLSDTPKPTPEMYLDALKTTLEEQKAKQQTTPDIEQTPESEELISALEEQVKVVEAQIEEENAPVLNDPVVQEEIESAKIPIEEPAPQEAPTQEAPAVEQAPGSKIDMSNPSYSTIRAYEQGIVFRGIGNNIGFDPFGQGEGSWWTSANSMATGFSSGSVRMAKISPDANVLELAAPTDHYGENSKPNKSGIEKLNQILGTKFTVKTFDGESSLMGIEGVAVKLKNAGIDIVRTTSIEGVADYVLNEKALIDEKIISKLTEDEVDAIREINDPIEYARIQKIIQSVLFKPAPAVEQAPTAPVEEEQVIVEDLPRPRINFPASQGDISRVVGALSSDELKEMFPDKYEDMLKAAGGDEAALDRLNAPSEEQKVVKQFVADSKDAKPIAVAPLSEEEHSPLSTPVPDVFGTRITQKELSKDEWKGKPEDRTTVNDARKEYWDAVKNGTLDQVVTEALLIAEDRLQKEQHLRAREATILSEASAAYDRAASLIDPNSKDALMKRRYLADRDRIWTVLHQHASEAGSELGSRAAFRKTKMADFVRNFEEITGKKIDDVDPAIKEELLKIQEEYVSASVKADALQEQITILRGEDVMEGIRDLIEEGVEGDEISLDELRALARKTMEGKGTGSLITKAQATAIQNLVKGYIRDGLLVKASTKEDMISLLRQDVGDYTDFAFYQAVEGVKGKKKTKSDQAKIFAELKTQSKLARKIIDAYNGIFDKLQKGEDVSEAVESLRFEFNTLSRSDAFKQQAPDRQLQQAESIDSILYEIESMSRELKFYKGDPGAVEQTLLNLLKDVSSGRTAQDKYLDIVANLAKGKITADTKPVTAKQKSEVRLKWEAALKEARAQLQAARQQALEDFLDNKATPEQQLYAEQQEQKQFEKASAQLDKLEEMVAQAYLPPKTYRKRTLSKRLTEIKKKNVAIMALLRQMAKNEDLRQQIKTGEFYSPWRAPAEISSELEDARMITKDLEAQKNAIIDRQLEKPRWEKAVDFMGIFRVLQSTGEFSFMQIQLGSLIVSHPKVWLGSWRETMKQWKDEDGRINPAKMFSGENFDRILEAMKQDPAFLLYEEAGAQIQDPTAGYQASEETTGPRDKEISLGPVSKYVTNPLNRASALALDFARFELFKQEIETGKYLTEDQRRDLVSNIDTTTGRGPLPKYTGTTKEQAEGKIMFTARQKSKLLNGAVYSARLASAQIMYPWMWATSKGPARTWAGKQLVKSVGGYFTMLTLYGVAFGFENAGLDPEDGKSFLKVKIGGTWVTPPGPLMHGLKIGLRLAYKMGCQMSGYDSDISVMRTVAQFVWYKRTPGLYGLTGFLYGEDFMERTKPRWQVAAELPVPMSFSQYTDTAADRNLNAAQKMFLGLATFAGVQTLTPEEEKVPLAGGLFADWERRINQFFGSDRPLKKSPKKGKGYKISR